mgnify:CR=1 FL=1
MILRNYYLNQLIKSKENGFPKVITGIRRCGKSYLLKNIFKDYLISNGVEEDNIIIIELDDIANSHLRNPFTIFNYIKNQLIHNNMNYIIIDEIQLITKIKNPEFNNGKIIVAEEKDNNNVITFIDVVLGLSRIKNVDLYVTGSNSKMLSTDIATEFRDKATNIHIGPLSFEEYHNYVKGSPTDALYSYMQYGGMPLAVLKAEEEKKEYLKGLFETTYFKDILEHNKIRKQESFEELCNLISEECGQLINTTKISNIFKSVKKESIDKEIVDKYINYLKDAFIISEVKRYDIKGNNEIGALRKYYFTDIGLRNAKLNFAYTDEGQVLENIVYNELIYNGYIVNVGTYDKVEKNKDGKSIKKNYEIDFIAKKGFRQYYIQVTSDISNLDTRIREIKPFISLNDQIQKVLIINKPINETRDSNGFTIIGIVDFLLRFIK